MASFYQNKHNPPFRVRTEFARRSLPVINARTRAQLNSVAVFGRSAPTILIFELITPDRDIGRQVVDRVVTQALENQIFLAGPRLLNLHTRTLPIRTRTEFDVLCLFCEA